MAPPRRKPPLLPIAVGLLLFGGAIVLQNSDKLLSISGVRGVHVMGLAAGGALCGTALVGVIVNLVVGRAGKDKAGPAT